MGDMMQTPGLSPTMVSRKLQVLAFIEHYFAAHGTGPSMGEIAAGCGHINRMRALDAVNALHREGRIHRTIGVARSIRPLTADEEAIRRLQSAGYAVTKTGLHEVPDLDHSDEDGAEDEKN